MTQQPKKTAQPDEPVIRWIEPIGRPDPALVLELIRAPLIEKAKAKIAAQRAAARSEKV